MKHRLQGDKKTLASDCRMPGLILARLWRCSGLADGVFFFVAPAHSARHTGGCTKPMREGTIPAKLRQDTSVVQISESKSELSIRMQKVTHARQLANILECSATQPALRLPQKLLHRVKVRSTENQKSTLPASCLIPSTREST